MNKMSKETHLRSIVKAVVYRILAVIAIMLISVYAIGSTWAEASQVGGMVIVLGTLIYYLHDRMWGKTSLLSDENGRDHVWRSVIKTVMYRCFTLIAGFIIATLILKASASGATLFAVLSAATNIGLYYVVERVFNLIDWGRK